MKMIENLYQRFCSFQFTYRMGVWIFFLVLSFFVFWNFLLSPTFSLVDDGYSLMKGRALITHLSIPEWSHTLAESNIGRFRPVYLLYFSLVYVLFGHEPIGLWFMQSLVLWVTLGMIYEILFLITKKKFIATVVPFIWLFMPAVLENMLRMGTAEPRQLLFVLLTFFFLLQYREKKSWKQLGLGILFTLCAIGTKETSIFLLPLYPLFIWEERIKKVNPLFLLGVFSVLIVLLVALTFLGVRYIWYSGYAVENFGGGFTVFKERIFQNRINFAHYYIILWATFILLALRTISAFWLGMAKKFFQKSVLSLALLMLIAEMIFFTLAWAFQFERYMYVTWTLILILAAIEVFEWTNLLAVRKFAQLSNLRLAFLVVAFIGLNVAGFIFIFKSRGLEYPRLLSRNMEIYRRTYDVNQVEHKVIEKLLSNHSATTLYTTNDNYEVIYELGVYLSQLGARPIKVVGPSKELAAAEDNHEFHSDPYAAYLADPSMDKVIVGRVADRKEVPAALAPDLLEPMLAYDDVPADQFWWYADPTTTQLNQKKLQKEQEKGK